MHQRFAAQRLVEPLSPRGAARPAQPTARLDRSARAAQQARRGAWRRGDAVDEARPRRGHARAARGLVGGVVLLEHWMEPQGAT